MRSSLRLALQFAMTNGQHEIETSGHRASYNLRQKFYRARDEIRESTEDPLSLVADSFSFLVEGKKLVIKFDNTIWESLNEPRSINPNLSGGN